MSPIHCGVRKPWISQASVTAFQARARNAPRGGATELWHELCDRFSAAGNRNAEKEQRISQFLRPNLQIAQLIQLCCPVISPRRSKPSTKSLLICMAPKLKKDNENGGVPAIVRVMLLVSRTFTHPAVAAIISNGFPRVDEARTPKNTNMNIVITSSLQRNPAKAWRIQSGAMNIIDPAMNITTAAKRSTVLLFQTWTVALSTESACLTGFPRNNGSKNFVSMVNHFSNTFRIIGCSLLKTEIRSSSWSTNRASTLSMAPGWFESHLLTFSMDLLGAEGRLPSSEVSRSSLSERHIRLQKCAAGRLCTNNNPWLRHVSRQSSFSDLAFRLYKSRC